MHPSSSAWLRLDAAGAGEAVLHCGGRWRVGSAGELDRALQDLAPPAAGEVTVDLAAVESLDTAGAWLLLRTRRRLEAEGLGVRFTGASRAHAALLEEVTEHAGTEASPRPREAPVVRGMVEHLGRVVTLAARNSVEFVVFLGAAVTALGRTIRHPSRLRFTSLVFHMERVGLDAVPIVGLISLLIGVVLGYQGASQLERFGAQVLVVDLVALSILREIGILLTSIVVAGRSGSAFTAQIGSMKLREEIDAMRTLGLDPMEVLVLPRMLALGLTLPLLAVFSDLMGLLGGALMAWASLGVTPEVFLERLAQAVTPGTFWVGVIKAPFFAALIALVGCFEGLSVGGSAESVGHHTTRSVVEAIFLVIVADALFSVFFNVIGV